MIKELLTHQNIDYIGAFIASYAEAIMAHINPSNLHKNNIAMIIKNDGTIWATQPKYFSKTSINTISIGLKSQKII